MLEALARLIGGVAVDPQSATILGGEDKSTANHAVGRVGQRSEPHRRLDKSCWWGSPTNAASVPVDPPYLFLAKPHMQAKEIKSGHVVNYHEAPCLIEAVTVQSPTARGAATFYKIRAEPDHAAEGGHHAQGRRQPRPADFRKRPIKFMYADATHVHFLDQEDYNQYSPAKEDVVEESKYLTEELEGVQALIYNDECVGIQLPVAVALTIAQCDPAMKGASADCAEQAGHTGDGPDRPGARVPRRRREDQGRHAHRRLSLPRVNALVLHRFADPREVVAGKFDPATGISLYPQEDAPGDHRLAAGDPHLPRVAQTDQGSSPGGELRVESLDPHVLRVVAHQRTDAHRASPCAVEPC